MFSNSSANPRNITPYVTISSLKLQVFHFKDEQTGDLDNGEWCRGLLGGVVAKVADSLGGLCGSQGSGFSWGSVW